MSVKHPYFPRDLKLPHYAENEKSVVEILTWFFGFLVIAMTLFWLYLKTFKHLRNGFLCRFKLCWFFSCAMIHTILEGYFAVFHKTLAGEQTFLAQLWKEYGKGDSRYISGDTFTVCMEAITAFIDGPLAVLAVLGFLYNSPHRYVTQLILSLCQLYGDVLYFTTAIMEGFKHGPMYHPLYFWFYFFFMNIIWIIIPSICIWESCSQLIGAQFVKDEKNNPSNDAKRKKYT